MKGSNQFEIQDGVLTKYTGRSQKVVLPDGLTEIGKCAFMDHAGLKQVVFPASLTKIGWRAFQGCTGLTEVVFPASLTEIGDYAFKDCTGLTQAVLPDGLTEIEGAAFEGCTGLTELVLPGSLRRIGYNAFDGCRKLTRLLIPEGVEEIKGQAFRGCAALEEISLPASLNVLEGEALGSCPNLREIKLAEGSAHFCLEGHALYNRDKTTLIRAFSIDGAFTVPDNVKRIDRAAFLGCGGLTQARLPQGLEEIESCAFLDCGNLREINLPESLTVLGSDVFLRCRSLTSLKIPAGVLRIPSGMALGCNSLRMVEIQGRVQECSGTGALCISPFDSGVPVLAPCTPVEVFNPDEKLNAVLGFARLYEEGREMPEEVRSGYLAYIKRQRRKLYELALEDAPLLALMLKEKMIPKRDVPEVLELAGKAGKPEASAMLLEYQNRLRRPGDEEREFQKAMQKLDSSALTVAEAQKIWSYEKTEEGTIRLLSYRGREEDVVVPERIGRTPVTEIGPYAFSPASPSTSVAVIDRRKKIRSVVVPEGVVRLGECAFRCCDALVRVQLPSSVKELPSGLSSACRSLKDARVRKIKDNAFFGCPNLTIRAPAGSKAEQYARKHKIPFEAL